MFQQHPAPAAYVRVHGRQLLPCESGECEKPTGFIAMKISKDDCGGYIRLISFRFTTPAGMLREQKGRISIGFYQQNIPVGATENDGCCISGRICFKDGMRLLFDKLK